MSTEEKCETTGKVRRTRREAMNMARRWRLFHFARMSHYRCKACGAWHIGNNRSKPRRTA